MKFKANVIEGKKIGSKFGVATANLEWNNALKLNLNEGVYLVHINFNKIKFNGILHIGKVKTLDQNFSIEVHIFDFDKNIYGKSITVEILKFIRPTQKFKNIDVLFEQIKKDIVQAKKYFLRQKIYKEWNRLNNQKKEILSKKAIEKITTIPEFKNTSNVLIYAPEENREIDFTQKLMEMFPEKKFYFPKVQEGKMFFYKVNNFSELQKGAFDIYEPQDLKNPWQQTDETFIFVPAVATDKKLFRLGRGGGFYDKFLEKIKKKYSIFTTSVLPDFAVLSEIPVEKHDEKINLIYEVSI